MERPVEGEKPRPFYTKKPTRFHGMCAYQSQWASMTGPCLNSQPVRVGRTFIGESKRVKNVKY